MMSTATTQRAVAGPLRRAGSPDSPVVNTIGTARASAGAGLAWRRRVGAAFATTSPKRIERRARRGDSRTIETITVAAARGGDYGTSVGRPHESGPSGQAAPILAGVAFFGTFFAAMAMRKRRERQRRRARGDVARQRLRSAAGAGRVATRSDLAAQPASFPNPNSVGTLPGTSPSPGPAGWSGRTRAAGARRTTSSSGNTRGGTRSRRGRTSRGIRGRPGEEVRTAMITRIRRR